MSMSREQALTEAMAKNGETWADVEAHTLTAEQLDGEFNNGLCIAGYDAIPFTLWTKNNVYFPGCYEGTEWVATVPRNPNGIATEHVGGG